MGAGRPRRAEREGPDGDEFCVKQDEVYVGRDWSERQLTEPPEGPCFPAPKASCCRKSKNAKMVLIDNSCAIVARVSLFSITILSFDAN